MRFDDLSQSVTADVAGDACGEYLYDGHAFCYNYPTEMRTLMEGLSWDSF